MNKNDVFGKGNIKTELGISDEFLPNIFISQPTAQLNSKLITKNYKPHRNTEEAFIALDHVNPEAECFASDKFNPEEIFIEHEFELRSPKETIGPPPEITPFDVKIFTIPPQKLIRRFVRKVKKNRDVEILSLTAKQLEMNNLPKQIGSRKLKASEHRF